MTYRRMLGRREDMVPCPFPASLDCPTRIAHATIRGSSYMPMRIHTWNAQRCDARGVGPAMLVPETLSQRCLMPEALSQRCLIPEALSQRCLIPEALSQRCLMPEALSQRCLMPFLAMPDPEVLPMQRSLPSVGSLAHTTSRTTRTENPARCRLLDARLHNYTTPNTTRRPTQHDAQYTAQH
jgi:hypothetical protein